MLGAAAFQRQILKRRLWSKQTQLCEAIETRRSVSVKGCHGSGKTFTVSGLVPYELLKDTESVVLTVAPTFRQVKLIWNEIEGAIQAIERRLGKLPERSTTGWRLSEMNYALGFSASKGVNAQGFHGKRVLILVDEAIGIASDLWDAIEGIRAAGDVRMVKLCNPTVPSGAPYEDFTRNRASTECITISAFDTPNLAGLTMESLLELPEDELDLAPYPWLTRRRWVKEMYFKWGPTNPRFQSRVLGEFPTQADDSVFSLADIERAALPLTEADDAQLAKLTAPGMVVQIGIDVAGPGEDETTATARLGPFIIARDAWSVPDSRGKVVMFLAELRRKYPGARLVVVVDTVGVGLHMATHLMDHHHDVRPFVAGGRPNDPSMFTNWKAEAYWGTRERFKLGQVRGLDDEDTKAQLSDVRYRETSAGRIEIEPKDEAKKRGSTSPDRAESLIMAFAKPAQLPEGPQPLGQRVTISRF